MIVGGLVGEAATIIFVPPGSFEKSLSVAFTLIIAAGVWIEEVGGDASEAKSEHEIAELSARAADANKKASEAELALAQLEERLAPRKMTQEGQKLIADRISAFKGITGEIGTASPEIESMRLEMGIHGALSMGGWTIQRGQPTHTPVYPGGVCIDTTRDGLSVMAGVALAEALNEVGICAVPMPVLDGDSPRIFVTVGTKPDPAPDPADTARIIKAVKEAIGEAIAAGMQPRP
jgi:hypothetical protein